MRGARLVIAKHKAEKVFKYHEGFNPRNLNQSGAYLRFRWTKDEIQRTLGIYRKTKVPCSCCMCGNPRRYWGYITIREARQMMELICQFKEVGLAIRKPRYLKGWLD